jgi:hypothetical protein
MSKVRVAALSISIDGFGAEQMELLPGVGREAKIPNPCRLKAVHISAVGTRQVWRTRHSRNRHARIAYRGVVIARQGIGLHALASLTVRTLRQAKGRLRPPYGVRLRDFWRDRNWLTLVTMGEII